MSSDISDKPHWGRSRHTAYLLFIVLNGKDQSSACTTLHEKVDFVSWLNQKTTLWKISAYSLLIVLIGNVGVVAVIFKMPLWTA